MPIEHRTLISALRHAWRLYKGGKKGIRLRRSMGFDGPCWDVTHD